MFSVGGVSQYFSSPFVLTSPRVLEVRRSLLPSPSRVVTFTSRTAPSFSSVYHSVSVLISRVTRKTPQFPTCIITPVRLSILCIRFQQYVLQSRR